MSSPMMIDLHVLGVLMSASGQLSVKKTWRILEHIGISLKWEATYFKNVYSSHNRVPSKGLLKLTVSLKA